MVGLNASNKLQQLDGQLLALGSQVEGLLVEATDMLYYSELDALEQLDEQVRQVHKKRLSIEMGCLGLIASQRPQGGDLRPLLVMVEIAADLERMADHCQRIARANFLTVDHQLRTPLASVRVLASEVQVLLDGALTAFAARDLSAAQASALGIPEVEVLYQKVRREHVDAMGTKPRIAGQAIFLARSAYSLQRVAERVAGICEWVEFTVEGSLGTSDLVAESPVHSEQHLSLQF